MSNRMKKDDEWNVLKANWNIKGLLHVLLRLIQEAEGTRSDKQRDPYEVDGVSSVPLVVGSLAVELSLKTILVQEAGEYPRTHDLEKLYDEISCQTRKQIEREWSSPSRNLRDLRDYPIESFGTDDVIKVGIGDVLKKHRRTFIELRYLPEKRSGVPDRDHGEESCETRLVANPYQLAYAAWTLYKFHVGRTPILSAATSGVVRR